MTEEEAQELAQMADALVDLFGKSVPCAHNSNRPALQLMILCAVKAAEIKGAPYDKTSLAARLNKPKQTVSRHCNVLIEEGLVLATRVGHQDILTRGPDTNCYPNCPLVQTARRLANLGR